MCEECDSCHDRTGKLVVEGQSNPLFVPSVIKTHIPLTDDPAQPQEDLLQRNRERIQEVITTRLSEQILYWYGIPDHSWSWTVFHDERHWRIPVVSALCQETKVYLNQKVGFEGTPRLDPYWKLQPIAYKVNMEWKSESSLWTRTILTRGSEFLMAWTSWSQTWQDDNEQETSEMQFEDLPLKNECTCFCKPIKGQSKTTKTYFCQLIRKNASYWWKKVDRYWTTRLFAHQLSSVEETDQSSSSW